MAQDDARYERNPNFIFRRIVDEAVLVPIHQDVADLECIYTLNETGAMIWQLLTTPATAVELRRAILDQYEADPATVDADLGRFLEGMAATGAIRKL